MIAEIRADTFGNAYRGTSLETVLDSIAEQRQVFKGGDHAFMWKPKVRIPDIYENRPNQVAFGNFLDTCLCCNTEEHVIEAIQTLDRATIKGLGPAAANLLYFLHPTIAPPFNTAIVRGYNALTGAEVKLGRWEQYLAMRRGILSHSTRSIETCFPTISELRRRSFSMSAPDAIRFRNAKTKAPLIGGSPTLNTFARNPQHHQKWQQRRAKRITPIPRYKAGCETISPLRSVGARICSTT